MSITVSKGNKKMRSTYVLDQDLVIPKGTKIDCSSNEEIAGHFCSIIFGSQIHKNFAAFLLIDKHMVEEAMSVNPKFIRKII
jgi:hypothetical protein